MVLAGELVDADACLVVDRFHGPDHQFHAETVVNHVVAGPSERIGERMIPEQSQDRLGECGRVVGSDQQPRPAILDHFGNAADVRGDHRSRQRHCLEDRQPLGLPV